MRKVEPREYLPGQRAGQRALAEITDLIDDGVYEAASVMAWEVQRSTPGDPAVWLLLTRIDYLRERYAAAMYAARMATRLDPSSAEAWLWLARTGATRARWRTEGLDAALQATALAPEDPQTWTALAELHLACDARYEAAIAAERAVRVGPDDVDAHRMLGTIALRAEEWRHAVAAFRRVLSMAPDDIEAREGLVTALEALHIDPSGELDRYGPAPQRESGLRDRVRQLAQESLDLAATTRAPSRRRGLLVGVAVCAVAGALVGLALPGVGVTRGLAAAAALVLMWVAIWPLRRQPRPVVSEAGSTVADNHALAAEPQPQPSSGSVASERAPAPSPPVAPEPATVAPAARPVAAGPAPPVARPAPPQPSQAATPKPSQAPDALRPAASAGGSDQVGTGGSRTPAAASTAGRGTGPERPRRLKRPPQDQPVAPETRHAGRPAPVQAHGEAPSAEPAKQAPAVDGTRQQTAPASEEHTGGPDGLPDDPAELVALSQARLAEFDIEAARAAATRLAEVSPDSLEAHRALAAVALAAQDYAQAELHYGKVLEIEPLDQDAHERLAMAKKGRRREEQQRHRRRKG